MNFRNIRTVLFDLDGTLLNTLDDLSTSVALAMRDLGLEPCTRDQVRQYVGSGGYVLCRRCLGETADDSRVQALMARFQFHYKQHLRDQTAPYPGIVDLLKALHDHGVSCGVVSNKFSAASKAVCAEYFPGLIDVVVGEEPGVAIKPAPDTLLTAMARLGTEPSQCVMVGDSPQDILAARNAGCVGIGVTWGFRSKEQLIEAGADMTCDDPGQILRAVTDSLAARS